MTAVAAPGNPTAQLTIALPTAEAASVAAQALGAGGASGNVVGKGSTRTATARGDTLELFFTATNVRDLRGTVHAATDQLQLVLTTLEAFA